MEALALFVRHPGQLVSRDTLSRALWADVVVTDGLKSGDRLIVKGHRSIVDGTLVKVVAERKTPKAETTPEPAPEAANKTVDPKLAERQ